MVKRLRVEFLIPLKYKDGTDVEPKKLFEVREKVVSLFGVKIPFLVFIILF